MYRVEGVIKIVQVTKNTYSEGSVSLGEIYRILDALQRFNLKLKSILDISRDKFYTLKEKLDYDEVVSFFNRYKRETTGWVGEQFTVVQLRHLCRKLGYTRVKFLNKDELVYLVCKEQELFWKEIVPKILATKVYYINQEKTSLIIPGRRNEYDFLILNSVYGGSNQRYWTLKAITDTEMTEFEIDMSKFSQRSFVKYMKNYLKKRKDYLIKIVPGVSLSSLISNNKNPASGKIHFDFSTREKIKKELKYDGNDRSKIDVLLNGFKRRASKSKIKKYLHKALVISEQNVSIGQKISRSDFIGLGSHLRLEFIKQDFYMCKVSKEEDTSLLQALYQVSDEFKYNIRIV